MSIIEKAMEKLNPKAKAVEPDAPAENESPMPADSTANYRKIDLERLKQRNIISLHGESYSPMAEEFRTIKRPLLDNAFDKTVRNGNLIMVTSSLPGEGKTFCSVNLAMSIAMEMNRTVLLVDADVLKPSVLHHLGITADRGLMDLVQEKGVKVSDVLIRTNIENLTILPPGRHHKRATELLASNVMAGLLEDMAQRYPDRIILFDSPPLLVTTEASVLASHMGQIVMVVEAEKTPQPALKEALSLIESCDIVGLVLNKTPYIPGFEYYGYGYGYGYGKRHGQ